jgi:pyridoxal phosphate enzyme (YggS family)
MSHAIHPELIAELAERVADIRERISRACRRASRSPEEITLVGACKRQPLPRIAAGVCAGVTELGENYVQEARDKQAALAELLRAQHGSTPIPALRWRMIGHLQRNKARRVIGLFDCIDTVDRLSLARELDKRLAATEDTLDVCVQVNLSREEQKAGVAPEDLPALLAACGDLRHLRVVGLMTMPAANPDPQASRSTFAQLRELRDTLSHGPGGEQLSELNMGMSGDFEVAIEEGSTLVRVGTALYGAREQPVSEPVAPASG